MLHNEQMQLRGIAPLISDRTYFLNKFLGYQRQHWTFVTVIHFQLFCTILHIYEHCPISSYQLPVYPFYRDFTNVQQKTLAI